LEAWPVVECGFMGVNEEHLVINKGIAHMQEDRPVVECGLRGVFEEQLVAMSKSFMSDGGEKEFEGGAEVAHGLLSFNEEIFKQKMWFLQAHN